MLVRGGWLLFVLMFGFTLYDLSRPVLHYEEGSAFSIPLVSGIPVLITGTQTDIDGIHQFNDAQQLLSVIKLAKFELAESALQKVLEPGTMQPGKSLKFQVVNHQIVDVFFGWMPARMRITLAIPLRVKRMSAMDWAQLPGVGPSLAERIEEYRQVNGDFETLMELKSVAGIGSKRLENWRELFDDDNLLKTREKLSW